MLEKSQPGVPQHNAVAERTAQDVLYGARAVVVRVEIPQWIGFVAINHYWLIDNVLPMGQSAEVDVGVASPWKLARGAECSGKQRITMRL